MTIKLMLLALSLVVPPAGADAASLAPPGVAACSNCHPKAGSSETALRPLNGRSAGDIRASMIAFRNGKRQATVMGRIAKGFSEAEINAIAAWYAAQR
jgi:cytochrome subunit of sulfide dehydrogenase